MKNKPERKPLYRKFLSWITAISLLASSFTYASQNPEDERYGNHNSSAILLNIGHGQRDNAYENRNKLIKQVTSTEDIQVFSDSGSYEVINKQDNHYYLLQIHKELIKNWIPLSAKTFIGEIENIYSKWLLSHISTKEMAVTELIAPTQKFLSLLGTGILESFSDVIVEEKRRYQAALSDNKLNETEKHAQNIGKIFQNANLFGLLTSGPAIVGIRAIKPIMITCGYNQELYTSLDDYYRMLCRGAPLKHLCFLSDEFSIAEGHVRNALLISGISFFTCGLNYLFIKGPLKFDNIFEGIAVASTIETAFSLGGYLFIYYFQEDFKKYKIFNANFDISVLIKIFERGIPLFFKRLADIVFPFVYTQLIIPDNSNSLAALSLSSQLLLPSTILVHSIGRSTNLTRVAFKG